MQSQNEQLKQQLSKNNEEIQRQFKQIKQNIVDEGTNENIIAKKLWMKLKMASRSLLKSDKNLQAFKAFAMKFSNLLKMSRKEAKLFRA